MKWKTLNNKNLILISENENVFFMNTFFGIYWLYEFYMKIIWYIFNNALSLVVLLFSYSITLLIFEVVRWGPNMYFLRHAFSRGLSLLPQANMVLVHLLPQADGIFALTSRWYICSHKPMVYLLLQADGIFASTSRWFICSHKPTFWLICTVVPINHSLNSIFFHVDF